MTLSRRIWQRGRAEIEHVVQLRLVARLSPNFRCGGRHYPYFRHPAIGPSLNTWATERIVELPIAVDFVRNAGPDARVLELGNVLRQYSRAVCRRTTRWSTSMRRD